VNIEEARLYLEHTSKEDFNLEEHQKENRYQAIQVVLKEIERLKKENKHLNLQLDRALKDYEELQIKIDKSIEYIKKHSSYPKTDVFGIPKFLVFNGDIEKLLDILDKGE